MEKYGTADRRVNDLGYFDEIHLYVIEPAITLIYHIIIIICFFVE